jgi:hypothetical protein
MKDIKFILNKITEFCKVKEDFERCNKKDIYSNRLTYIINLVKELNIPYFVDDCYNEIENGDDTQYVNNLVLEGKNEKIIVAHYDIQNENCDNANDNSASVINAIALKYLYPDITVVLTDGEEAPFRGEGAAILGYQISRGKWDVSKNSLKEIKWILNLELTGLGRNICVSSYRNRKPENGDYLCDIIVNNFKGKIIDMPKNDATILSKRWRDIECVCTYPMINEGMSLKHFENCHKDIDNLSSISIDDMEYFVNNFLYPLCTENFNI